MSSAAVCSLSRRYKVISPIYSTVMGYRCQVLQALPTVCEYLKMLFMSLVILIYIRTTIQDNRYLGIIGQMNREKKIHINIINATNMVSFKKRS